MIRYFYPDPLAALWMAEHHGMSFKDSKIEKQNNECIEYTINKAGELQQVRKPWLDTLMIKMAANSQDGSYEVHPDCHELLKAQAGDVIRGSFDCWALDLHESGAFELSAYMAKRADDLYCERIIERNGKPFHWPEIG